MRLNHVFIFDLCGESTISFINHPRELVNHIRVEYKGIECIDPPEFIIKVLNILSIVIK